MKQNSNRPIQNLEAARHQLRTTIPLWFADGDPISIHTLTCAAHQILHDISVHQGGCPLLFDSIFVKDNRRTQWNHAMRTHMNFFKHADKDPNGTIAFDPSLTEPFIMLSLLTLEDLGAQHTSEETAFFLWCALNNSDWLNEQGLAKFIHHLPVQHLAHLRHIPKQRFQHVCQFLIRQIALGQ